MLRSNNWYRVLFPHFIFLRTYAHPIHPDRCLLPWRHVPRTWQSRQPAAPRTPEPARNSPAGDTVDKSLSPASVNGIRFVLKTPMTLPEVIYMPIDGKRLEKVELRAALPGRRSVYPRSKIITLFGGLDQKGMPTNKLVSKPLPDNLGPKTLALVGKNSKGEFTLDFINEAELPMNCIYIQNLTGRTFTLELPNLLWEKKRH